MTPESEEKLLSDVGLLVGMAKSQAEELQEHTRALEGINYSLNGNGTPGLKQQVAGHDSTLSTMKKVMWIVATPVLAAVGGGLVTGVVYLIRILPKS